MGIPDPLSNPMSDPLLGDSWMVGDLKKRQEKKLITTVIAPEHDEKHRENKSKMKKSEKQLINQLINHGHTFKSDFKNVAKGDWFNKAMQDLDKLGNELKKIMN
ncbi:TPA: hypothetical protein ACOGH3_000788 [Staphylococcus aureus]|nr:hypothetical protein [Staphylococcus aureus]HDR3233106.1 hypothetical protein [Staphylococcus aureus]